MPTSGSNTTRGGAANHSNTNDSSLQYETGAFSSNVTPPLNFKTDKTGNPSSSSSNSATTASRPIFGGKSRATVTETQMHIPDTDGALPQYTQRGIPPASSTSTSSSRRLSFAFTSSSDPSEGAPSTRGATKAATKGGTRTASSKATSSNNSSNTGAIPPAIPDELLAALLLPPGSAINASTIKKADIASTTRDVQHTKLSSLESFSPFNLKSDIPWATSTSTSPHLTDNSNFRGADHDGSFSGKSSSNSLRIRALLEASSSPSASSSNHQHPSTPHITPATPSPKNTYLASPTFSGTSSGSASIDNSRKSLRKAASAESLRTNASRKGRDVHNERSRKDHDYTSAYHDMRGLGIVGTTSTISANFLPREDEVPSVSTTPTSQHNHQVPKPAQQQHLRTDMKSLFKSFSAKLQHIRPSASSSASSVGNPFLSDKRSDQRYPSHSVAGGASSKNSTLTSPPPSNSGSITIGRKSFDSSIRHSLSLYPRRSNDKLPTSASTANNGIVALRPTRSGSSTGSRDSVCFPRSKSEKDILEATTYAKRVPSDTSTQREETLNAARGELSIPDGILDIEDGQTSSWLSRENFTHDLNHRNKKSKRTSGASAIRSRLVVAHEDEGIPAKDQVVRVGANDNCQDAITKNEVVDSGEEEDEDVSELASQISDVDSVDLTPSQEAFSSLDDPMATGAMAGYSSEQPQRSSLRRNTSPVNPMSMTAGAGMAAALQRTRADSDLLIPPKISTDLVPNHSEFETHRDLEQIAGREHGRERQETAKNLTPPKMTPDTASTVYVDAFSSPLITGSLSPSQQDTFTFFAAPNTPPAHAIAKPAQEDSTNQTVGVKVEDINQSPSLRHTHAVRPRSMSESYVSSALSTGHGAEVRAAQPNKSTILNGSMLNDVNQRIMEERDETESFSDQMREGDQGQGHFGSGSANVSGRSSAGLDVSQRTSTSSFRMGNHTSTSHCRRQSVIDFEETDEDGEHEALEAGADSLMFSLNDNDITVERLQQLSPSKKSGADYVVAMVGPKQVGKSTIIANNLRLSGDKCTLLYEDEKGNKVLSYSGSYSITGISCTIEVLEVDMDLLKSTAEGLTWPAEVPRPEGVMICYKYGDPKGLEHLKTLLHGFWTRGGIHLIALATQCPAIQEGAMPYKAEGDKAAEICNIHGAGLVHLDGGIEDPNRKARNSLQWVLRKILESRGQESRSPSKARKLITSKRSTAALLAKQSAINPSITESIEHGGDSTVGTVSDAGHSLKTVSTLSINSVQSGDPSLETDFSPSKHGHSLTDIYLSRDSLVQKVLFAVVAGNDEEYVSGFLIVFRRFETPYNLLNSWFERFNMASLHVVTDPLLSRQVHMSLCKLLARWIKFHPHDFCGSNTKSLLDAILTKLYTCTWVVHWAMEIEESAKGLGDISDKDTAWTLPDPEELSPLHAKLLADAAAEDRRPSLVPSIASAISGGSGALSVQTSIDLSSQDSVRLARDSGLPDDNHDSPVPLLLASRRGVSFSPSKATFGESAVLVSTSMSPQSSNQSTLRHQRLSAVLDISNAVLEVPVQPLARQITKHVWDVFASMQPRDLLRYIMVPRDPKHPDARPQRNADNPVTQAVAFSNYLSNWTASLLLVQSKQKSRARMYEYLIRLALALRALDNLDSLRLNSTPIHRLHDLASSVPEVIYKKFRSMNFLMASTRSFAAYRLALTTARPEVIPYLGVHLQDITRVHDGKSDMRDGLVNWSKMRQIGKYASTIAHCARLTPYYTHDERLSKLVTDVAVFSLDSDDDTLYELSYSYKPRQKRSGSSSQTAKLKRMFKEAISTPGISSFNQSAAVL